MAIPWPDGIRPSSMTWGLKNNNRAFTSTLTNSQQIVGAPGDYWFCTLQWDVLDRGQERILTSTMGKLDGMFGEIAIPAFNRTRADNIGTPAVVLAPSGARSINVNGMTAGTSFRAGDYISLAGEMFEVTDTATAAANGTATVSINKRIRTGIAAGTVIEYKKPFAVMRLVSDENSLTVQPWVANGSVQFREAF